MSGRGRGGGRGGGRAMDLPSHPRGGSRGGGRGDRGGGDRGGFRGDRGGDRGGYRGDRGGDRGGGRGGGRGRGGGGGGPPVPAEVFRQGTSPQVDASITKLEDETVATAKQALTPAGVKSISPTMPARPGYSIKGKPVVLWANYFKMMPPGDLELYRYDIKITNVEASSRTPTPKLIRRLIQILIEEQFIPNNIHVATDFRSNLISKTKQNFEPEYVVILRSEGEDEPPANPKQFRITITPTGSLTVSELIDYLTSPRASEVFDNKDEIIQALNIVLGHHPKAASAIANVGRNRHFDKAPPEADQLDLGAGLKAIRGFFVSVRAATARVLLNVQVKNMAFYSTGKLTGLILAYNSENGNSLAKLSKFLKKVNIDMMHLDIKNKVGRRIPRIKTIWGLAMKDDGRKEEHPPRVQAFGAGPKNVQFWLKTSSKSEDTAKGASPAPTGGKKGKKGGAKPGQPSSADEGKYISVYDYFTQERKVPLNRPDLPVVNVGSRDRPVYLPPEVCEVIPGQPADAKLSPRQTQSMIQFAVRKPHLNATSIVTTGNKMLGLDPSNDTLSNFGTNITPQMIAVPGRVLNGPELFYAGKRKIMPRFASWNLQGVKVAGQTSLPSWVFLRIYWDGQPMLWQNPQAMNNTIQAFQNMLNEIGVRAGPCNGGLSERVDSGNYEARIDAVINQFANPGPKQQRPHLIFVIVPDRDNTAIYNRVKYNCDVKHGFLNVCVVDSKFFRANEQYYANVGLKFNLKLGGGNHTVQPDNLGFIKERKTMVVGIDVTHPSPGSSQNAPSVAGIVASVDETLNQWPADIRVQRGRQEMVDALDEMFEGRLRLWQQKHNNALPENIIVYRDGVSEGQYDIVLTQELNLLKETCKRLYSGPQPKMTILVVGKRHHTRFYVTDEKNMDRSGNPQNGTVVERGVTESRNWDFFMQAHTALQGTARPAHYYVIYDEIFRERQAQNPSGYNATEKLQELTHNMCYLFGRATKAVSICPPAYYADLVCERARCYLSGLFDPSPITSPTGSAAASASGSVPSADISNGVRIHERVKDTMFYV